MESQRTILVVDDDADSRLAAAQALEDAGYHVETATNGLHALERLRLPLPAPALVLLDLMMPVMDGWRFRAEQLADPALASIPVVVMSAHGDPLSLTAAAFLRKPVELDLLLETVARHAGPARPHG